MKLVFYPKDFGIKAIFPKFLKIQSKQFLHLCLYSKWKFKWEFMGSAKRCKYAINISESNHKMELNGRSPAGRAR